jgi:hypothetical protein
MFCIITNQTEANVWLTSVAFEKTDLGHVRQQSVTKGQLGGFSLGYRLYFCVFRPTVKWSRNRLSSDQWILRHVLKFQLRRAKHHAKRDRRYRFTNSERLLTLPLISDGFLTVFVDRCLLSRQCCSCRQIHWSDESRFLLHLTVGRKTQKYSLYPNENPPNCPLWWRLSNGLGVYL